MHSYFWDGYNVGRFLVYPLNIETPGAVVGICIAISALTFLYEYLRFMQIVCRHKELVLRSNQLKKICPDEDSLLSEHDLTRIHGTLLTKSQRFGLVGADIGIWYSLLLLAYFLMLIIMTYNIWFFVSAVFGAGLGYFIFGQRMVKVNLMNYRILQETFCAPFSNGKGNGESTPALERSSSACPNLNSAEQNLLSSDLQARCDLTANISCDKRKCYQSTHDSSNQSHNSHETTAVVHVQHDDS